MSGDSGRCHRDCPARLQGFPAPIPVVALARHHPRMRRDALLFDLDGVLVDSRAAITSCINQALGAHGLPEQPPADLISFIGPPLASAFGELTRQAVESPLVTSCVSAYRARYAELSLRETTVVPGMLDVLAELVRDHRLLVATSKPRVYAQPLLDSLGLARFFDFCAAPELSASGENKAITIARALARVDGGHAVMIGDRALDIDGAHACSIPAIGVTWGAGSVEELSEAAPDAIIETPGELPSLVAELAERIQALR
jgi:phosphoglycolate phosphatase